jgi:hypothetical protein
LFLAKIIDNETRAHEQLERQYVIGLEDGYQEGYKMRLQDGWSRVLTTDLKKQKEAISRNMSKKGSFLASCGALVIM